MLKLIKGKNVKRKLIKSWKEGFQGTNQPLKDSHYIIPNTI